MALKRFYPAVSLAVLITALVLACGGNEAIPTTPPIVTQKAPADSAPAASSVSVPQTVSNLPQWKYVNSGWVSPGPEERVGALQEEFRVFVITSEEELDDFQERSRIRISRGNSTSLGRVDFPNSILIAAYFMWRPVQGDPLSVVGFDFEPGQDGTGGRADVRLELEDSPQGRERPYLLAPMVMVALDRAIFPQGRPIEFVFHLDGQPIATVSSTIAPAAN